MDTVAQRITVTLTQEQFNTVMQALGHQGWAAGRDAETTANHPDPSIPAYWRERQSAAKDAYAALIDAYSKVLA